MNISSPSATLLSDLTIDSDLDMASTYQVKNLAAPASGEALRKGNTDIDNAEVAADAAIAGSKLALTGVITNAMVNASAAIAYSKLDLSASVAVTDLTLASGKVARGTGSGATAVDKTESDIIDATRDMTAASGDVSYTGTGFTPISVAAMGAIGSSNIISFGVGDDGADEASLRYYTASSNWELSTTQFIAAYETGSKIQAAVLKTMDADGVTLTWTKYGSTSAGTYTFTLFCQA
tara:strand:- start:2354 stop:3061 length:708 start_codon:yes stop_codon:yes gene_type:complete